MIIIHYYENISDDMTIQVNAILSRLQKITDKITDSEKQYLFLT